MAAAAASCSTPIPNDAETLRRNRILSSKLYFDVPLTKLIVVSDNYVDSQVPMIYSSSYNIAFLGIEKLSDHVRAILGVTEAIVMNFLIKEGVLDKARLVEPLEASKDDLLVVHPESYLRSLKNSLTVSIIVEVPPVALIPNFLVQQKVLYPFRKQVGGSILAAKLAVERGWAINLGGGFHHCSAEKGGGFCAYADISLCIHFAFVRLNIS
ncbi:Histone deacetylase 2, partial [Ananas comosus]